MSKVFVVDSEQVTLQFYCVWFVHSRLRLTKQICMFEAVIYKCSAKISEKLRKIDRNTPEPDSLFMITKESRKKA